jgi:hypothetical protein
MVETATIQNECEKTKSEMIHFIISVQMIFSRDDILPVASPGYISRAGARRPRLETPTYLFESALVSWKIDHELDGDR